MNLKSGNKGSSVVIALIYGSIMVFVVLPIFAATIERFIILNKIQIIKDAVDITNISTYNAINTGTLSKSMITFDGGQLINIYKQMLMANLNLDENLLPEEASLADGKVEISSIILYLGSFPVICPKDTELTRPTIHSEVKVPIKPTLFREILLNKTGNEYVNLRIHVDSDIPIDN